jgi:hypothetical protein
MQSTSPGQALVAHKSRSYEGNPMQVTASLGAGSAGYAGLNVNGFWASNYQYYMTGIIPADPHLIDTSTLALFYRDMYFFDNVAGSCVDIQSHFPFSRWELRGLDNKELDIYHSALEQLNLQQMMPMISTAHLVDGFFCGSLVFDAKSKRFLDTLMHDALSCAVIPSPFFNIDPTINVRVGQATQQFMHDTSEYAKRYLDSMPSQFIEMLRSGAFTLDPVTTLFVPRRSTTDRAYTSYLHRVLPMYLLEKTLFRGTLVEAQRRQRAMTHLTAGDDTWTPTAEELLALVEQFQTAEYDPLGGWVSTRNAVQAVDIRPGGDFWKFTDMADVLVPYKLRALGISEALLSGDASFAAAESAYSTFLETQNSYREDLTDRVFYSKIFPLIAVTNNLYKDPSKRANANQIVDFLFNRNNRANLKMPELHWHKALEVKGEENMAELLDMASQKGIPIPLKLWMAAAHIEPEALIRDLEEDRKFRDKLKEITGKDTSYEAEMRPVDQDAEFDDGGDNEYDSDDSEDTDDRGSVDYSDAEEASVRAGVVKGPLTSQSMRKLVHGNRVPLLAREFNESDTFTLTKTGKIKHVPSAVAASRRQRMNDNIMTISRAADKDPHYRETLKRRNKEKLGSAKLR